MSTWFNNVKEDMSSLGSSIGGFFSNIGTNIDNKFQEWKQDRAEEKEQKEREKEEEQRQKELEKQKEKEDQQTNESNMQAIAGQVGGLVNDKFNAYYSLKDFLVEFWNAIFDSSDDPPTFNITLPEFCGGGTYNVLDLRFYNQYRSYIHGIIAGICYFVFIKRLYTNLPGIIK